MINCTPPSVGRFVEIKNKEKTLDRLTQTVKGFSLFLKSVHRQASSPSPNQDRPQKAPVSYSGVVVAEA